MGPTPKCHFVSGLPNGNPEIPKIETPTTLGGHNFVRKPFIKMKSKEKLYPLSKTFQWYVAHHLHARKSKWFLTFINQESNYQFDSRPFFWP
jgi:hypothetical protein